jgi:hypothetical protein
MGRRHIPGMKPATLIIELMFWFVKRGKECVPMLCIGTTHGE